ncbi:HTH-type transcriptional repressor YvoA [bacterium MnTg04]|nr:HTH-type transcriptional repressor YvoA [bacterium MnTg04]
MASERFDSTKLPPIDESSPTPLYHQIFLILRDRISDGTYAFESAMPSENEICRIFGVSRITAKRALDELASANLVVRRRGRGTSVSHRTASLPVHYSVEGLFEDLLAMGLKTEVELLSFDYEEAPSHVALALNCEPGAIVQHAIRVRRLEGGPFSYLTTWVPEDVGRSYSKKDVATKPLLVLLERDGVVVSSAEQTITATGADALAAKALAVEIGAPLLRISRVVRDQTERPVEYIVALYRPDRYQFRMDLTRVEGEERKRWSPTT